MRVFFSSLRCFFLAMRLRRFLMTEPTWNPRSLLTIVMTGIQGTRPGEHLITPRESHGEGGLEPVSRHDAESCQTSGSRSPVGARLQQRFARCALLGNGYSVPT